MIEITLACMFFIIMFCLIILAAIFNAHNTSSKKLTKTEKEKEKRLSELRYDSITKEGRYLKFKERYEFQERLRKEIEIKKDTN